MAKAKQAEKIRITLRDFVPPVVFKLRRMFETQLKEDNAQDILVPQLLAVMLTLAGLMLGILTFNVLPREVVALGKAVGYGDYSVGLSEKGMQAYLRFQKMQQNSYYAETGYVLGVKDDSTVLQEYDQGEHKDSTNSADEPGLFDDLDIDIQDGSDQGSGELMNYLPYKSSDDMGITETDGVDNAEDSDVSSGVLGVVDENGDGETSETSMYLQQGEYIDASSYYSYIY